METLRDARAVVPFLEGTRYFEATEGLMVEGWRALPYTPVLLEKRFILPGFCRGISGRGGLAGVAVCVREDRPSRTTVKIVALEARDDGVADALFDDVVRCAVAPAPSTSRRLQIDWMVPRSARLTAWSARWGLRTPEREDDFLVYELPLKEVGQ